MIYNKKIRLPLLVAFLMLNYFSTNAQKSYVGLSVGYGFSTKSGTGNYASTISSTTEAITTENGNIGYGGGLNINAKYGFSINDFIDFEIGVNYLFGKSSTVMNKYIFPNFASDFTSTSSSNMLQISPSILLSPNNADASINPYMRFGITAGFGSIVQTIETESTNFLSQETSSGSTTLKLSGGIALGVNAALGASFKLNEKIALFGEFNLLKLSYAPKREIVTEHTLNGFDALSDLTTSMRETEFYDEITINNTNQSADEPSKRLISYRNFGSLGLSFGVQFSFN